MNRKQNLHDFLRESKKFGKKYLRPSVVAVGAQTFPEHKRGLHSLQTPGK